jgi:hypothetical protein
MEKCVSKIKGTNKRTGKPYTKGEKIAICKAQLKENRSKSELSDFTEIDEAAASRVENAIWSFTQRVYKQQKAATLTDAYWLAQVYLEKCDYNIEVLNMVEVK